MQAGEKTTTYHRFFIPDDQWIRAVCFSVDFLVDVSWQDLWRSFEIGLGLGGLIALHAFSETPPPLWKWAWSTCLLHLLLLLSSFALIPAQQLSISSSEWIPPLLFVGVVVLRPCQSNLGLNFGRTVRLFLSATSIIALSTPLFWLLFALWLLPSAPQTPRLSV